MTKRGQLSASHIIVYVLVAIVAVLIFYFGYRAVFGVAQAQEKSTLEILKLQQKADVSKISAEQKTIRSYSYALPSGYEKFCFVDLTKKEDISASEMQTLKEEYPVIYDSIQSDSDSNAFLFGKDVQAYNVGPVRINCAPYYACFDKTGTNLIYRLEGKGIYATPSGVCPEVIENPPKIIPISTAPSNLNIQPGDASFKINAEDKDSTALKIIWTVDGVEKQTDEVSSVAEPQVPHKFTAIPVFTHTFSTIGVYNVRVKAVDEKGLFDDNLYTVRVSTAPAELPMIDCGFSTSCEDSAYTTLFYLSSDTNAHASTLPDYSQKVCCNVPDEIILPGCPGSHVLWLSGLTNAHASAQADTDYPTEICMKLDKWAVSCSARDACASDEECVVKLSAETNAHLESCSEANYQKSICCRLIEK